MARQRPPSLRIDVGDNSAVPARLRNILEAHPETASSSPGSARPCRARGPTRERRLAKSDTDTALREMLQLPQLRYAIGDLDIVPTDELRAHEREALVALHGLCTASSSNTDLGTAGARCKELIREAQQLRQPLAGLVGGGASPDVNLCTRSSSRSARARPAAARQRRPARRDGGQPQSLPQRQRRRRQWCRCHHRRRLQLLRDGYRQRERPAAGGGPVGEFRRRRRRRRRGRRVGTAGILCRVEPRARRSGSSRTRRRSYYHSLTSPSSTPRLSASLPQSNSVPDSLEGAAMAVPPPFTLAVPVERASLYGRRSLLPSPTAGFAAGFAAGGSPPPSVDVSGNSSKEAASPRQSRSSSERGGDAQARAAVRLLRAVGEVVRVSVGEQFVSRRVGKQPPPPLQPPPLPPSPARRSRRRRATTRARLCCREQTAAAAAAPPAEPVPAVRAASAASERYSDDEELAALGPPPGRSASQESLDAELAALGPPPTLDGRLRDSKRRFRIRG